MQVSTLCITGFCGSGLDFMCPQRAHVPSVCPSTGRAEGAGFRVRLVPHYDARFNPALDPAAPTDAAPGRNVSVHDPWRIEFGDGRWRQVTVRAWRQDRFGRDVIDIEWWTPEAGAYTGAYVADRKLMEEFDDDPPDFKPWPSEPPTSSR